MQWQTIQPKLLNLLRLSVKNNHNRIITCGILVGLFYLPTWLSIFWESTWSGSPNSFLNLGLIYIGLDTLWKQRRTLATMKVADEERLASYVLILGGAVLFGLTFSSVSLQALSFALVLVGVAYSTWGMNFFRQHPFSCLLILLSVYPDLSFFAITLWRTLSPPYLLENLMAWCGKWGLQAIGHPAAVDARYLSILPVTPARTVEVGSGCSGFDMAFSLAGFTFVLGLLLKLPWKKIAILMVVGIVLALVFNIPRIMLLTMAAVYWGKASFDFWHGPIGGQIFTAILFTVYYYVVMAAIDQKPTKTKS